jgi:hypothetical protein
MANKTNVIIVRKNKNSSPDTMYHSAHMRILNMLGEKKLKRRSRFSILFINETERAAIDIKFMSQCVVIYNKHS